MCNNVTRISLNNNKPILPMDVYESTSKLGPTKSRFCDFVEVKLANSISTHVETSDTNRLLCGFDQETLC